MADRPENVKNLYIGHELLIRTGPVRREPRRDVSISLEFTVEQFRAHINHVKIREISGELPVWRKRPSHHCKWVAGAQARSASLTSPRVVRV